MSSLLGHLSGALDPVKLGAMIGLDPDPWQAKVLRHPHQRELLVVHRQGGKSVTAAVAAVHQALFNTPRSRGAAAAYLVAGGDEVGFGGLAEGVHRQGTPIPVALTVGDTKRLDCSSLVPSLHAFSYQLAASVSREMA